MKQPEYCSSFRLGGVALSLNRVVVRDFAIVRFSASSSRV